MWIDAGEGNWLVVGTGMAGVQYHWLYAFALSASVSIGRDGLARHVRQRAIRHSERTLHDRDVQLLGRVTGSSNRPLGASRSTVTATCRFVDVPCFFSLGGQGWRSVGSGAGEIQDAVMDAWCGAFSTSLCLCRDRSPLGCRVGLRTTSRFGCGALDLVDDARPIRPTPKSEPVPRVGKLSPTGADSRRTPRARHGTLTAVARAFAEVRSDAIWDCCASHGWARSSTRPASSTRSWACSQILGCRRDGDRHDEARGRPFFRSETGRSQSDVRVLIVIPVNRQTSRDMRVVVLGSRKCRPRGDQGFARSE